MAKCVFKLIFPLENTASSLYIALWNGSGVEVPTDSMIIQTAVRHI